VGKTAPNNRAKITIRGGMEGKKTRNTVEAKPITFDATAFKK
jgi:hypothetical protein